MICLPYKPNDKTAYSSDGLGGSTLGSAGQAPTVRSFSANATFWVVPCGNHHAVRPANTRRSARSSTASSLIKTCSRRPGEESWSSAAA